MDRRLDWVNRDFHFDSDAITGTVPPRNPSSICYATPGNYCFKIIPRDGQGTYQHSVLGARCRNPMLNAKCETPQRDGDSRHTDALSFALFFFLSSRFSDNFRTACSPLSTDVRQMKVALLSMSHEYFTACMVVESTEKNVVKCVHRVVPPSLHAV
ncbi:uncharacterized protein FOMMEDRAFT_161878 [Fomitiporia mediterranea MF3/22]|uniref:uncharacterized protein n=1 Tax=Fomitiporia mediterranea (strain MF3/22) TaxID=694068 RepID=UPI0004407E6B|nr:uncharacterized protein FOMMEDRAFT_161878 [Fomitiporia mediterranea MF3/22]EJC98502.1 hypothetical protein FOMMEDRAFT_161878 [Fomitiporia mediterranea MF3/22]